MTPIGTQKSAIRFVDSKCSIYFDLLRGLAAFFVLFGHWRNIFFIDYPQLTAHRRLFALPYLVSGAGHQAVILFFVLSGYFIGGTVYRSIEGGRWDWRGYVLRRTVRLWIVLIPALMLCLLWDKLGIHLGHAPALYSGHVSNHVVVNVVSRLGLPVFLSNLFFLQTIFTPVFGSDGALWSLANEFWYYILFPLGVIALWPRARSTHRLICAVLFIPIACLVRGGILASFPIWLAGVVLFKLPPPSFPPQTAKNLRITASIVFLPVFFLMAKTSAIPSLLNDYLLATITLLYLWILLSAQEPFLPAAKTVRASREMARFSYTLYALHIPFLVFLASLLIGDLRWRPGPANLLAGLCVLLATLIYAYTLAFFTEFRTDAIRQRLQRLLRIEASLPALSSNPLSDPQGSRSDVFEDNSAFIGR
jgi:peptidoglycan/LPS O-acetylase OafA/YrhL